MHIKNILSPIPNMLALGIVALTALSVPQHAKAQELRSTHVFPQVADGGTPDSLTNLDEIYADESHCLVAPEVRDGQDDRISCFCRDAITDVRYVWSKYLLPGTDRNLNGVYLTLLIHTGNVCGMSAEDLDEVVQDENWQWDGPEVVRAYPLDSEIERILPDAQGFRLVRYDIQLIYRDQGGRITDVDSFSALERLPGR